MKQIASLALTLATIIATAAGASACGRKGGPNGNLPDAETFYLALPEDQGSEGGNTASQAVCASTEGYDELKARILVYNEAIQSRVGLVKGMLAAAEKADGATFERSATRAGFTLTVAGEEADGQLTLTVTLTDPQGTETVLLDGQADAELTSGSWDFHGLAENREVHVEWTNVDGTLTVNRSATGDFGERTSTYVRTATDVDITFAGPQHDASAHWNLDSKDGSVIIDGNETCWDADEELSEFCSVECPAS